MKKLMLLLLLVSCGSGKTIEREVPVPVPTPTPTDEPGPPAQEISFQKMQGYLVNYCQSCHANASFMTGGEAALRNSQVKANLWSKRMPPASAPKALPENIRTEMISWF